MRKLVMVLLVAMVPATVLAATPSEGVPLKVRRGFFTETDIGGFFTVGGDNGYSNLQSYLQLGAGYQIGLQDERFAIPIGLTVGIGANAANCWAGLTKADECSQSDNFTMTMISASVGFQAAVLERFYFGGKVLGGYTLLDPPPVTDTSGATFSGGINLGAAIGVEYFTNMDHFAIGVDVGYRMVLPLGIQANIIHTLHFLLRVKYTF